MLLATYESKMGVYAKRKAAHEAMRILHPTKVLDKVWIQSVSQIV